MAGRRMFAKSIVLSDAFLDMPATARNLYFMLGMVADDDGVVSNPKSIIRQCGASEDDLKVLLAKRYLLGFKKSGIVIIKHWKMNNYIQKDRYNKSTYLDELSTLKTDERGAYTEIDKNVKNIEENEKEPENQENTECIQNVSKMDTECIQNGYTIVDTQVRLGKVSIDKDSSSSIKLSYDNNKDQEKEQDMQQVYDKLQQIFPNCSTSWVTAIDLYKDMLSRDLIINAIKETASSGSNSPKYFKSICDRYILNGFKTISDIKPKTKNARGSPNKALTRDEYNTWFEKRFLKKEST